MAKQIPVQDKDESDEAWLERCHKAGWTDDELDDAIEDSWGEESPDNLSVEIGDDGEDGGGKS